MKTVNMHEAKTHLSRLVAEAVKGEPFVIARAGKPMVRVVAVEVEETPKRRMGFLEGYDMTFPEDRAEFKAIGAEDIALMYEGE